MISSSRIAPDVDVLSSAVPIPGLGLVPVNAYLFHGREPMLVETGTGIDRDDFLRTLGTLIDPMDLRWIWLSHTDPDHTGSLQALLDLNPRLKVITTFLGVGIMSLTGQPPMDRLYLLNPGERLQVGDRMLAAYKPPVFDNPCTTAFHEERSNILFTADAFGALLPSVPERAEDIPTQQLRDGQVLWSTIDTPWIHKVDRQAFTASLDTFRTLDPTLVLSNHLPPAPGRMLPSFLDALAQAPGAAPFVGPNQATLEQMLASMA